MLKHINASLDDTFNSIRKLQLTHEHIKRQLANQIAIQAKQYVEHTPPDGTHYEATLVIDDMRQPHELTDTELNEYAAQLQTRMNETVREMRTRTATRQS